MIFLRSIRRRPHRRRTGTDVFRRVQRHLASADGVGRPTNIDAAVAVDVVDFVVGATSDSDDDGGFLVSARILLVLVRQQIPKNRRQSTNSRSLQGLRDKPVDKLVPPRRRVRSAAI